MAGHMFHRTDDLRIKWTKEVIAPNSLEEELPTTEKASSTVFDYRQEICDILGGKDRRLLVIVGPCSIHDTRAAREYAGLLKGAIAEFSQDLCIVMRVYFEKPRTIAGWKGLLNDPYLDQSFKINDGLRLARTVQLGRDRRAHHREPGAPPTRFGPFVPCGIQECDFGRRADRH